MNQNINPLFVKQGIANLKHRCPEIGEDEALRLDMLEAETGFHELMAEVYESVVNAETMMAAIKIQEELLKGRRESFKRRAENWRRFGLELMQYAEVKTLPLTKATLYVQSGKNSVLMTAPDDAVPSEFCRTKTVVEPDKTAIKDALESGAMFNFATLKRGEPTLGVRTR